MSTNETIPQTVTPTSTQSLPTGLPPGHLDYVPGGLQTFLTVYLVIAGVAGVVGNSMTIVSILCNRKLKTIPNVYVANLAVTDLIMCTVGVPFAVYTHNAGSAGLYSEEGYFSLVDPDDKPTASSLCIFMGCITLNSMCMSMYNLTLIAINRYILLVKGTKLYARLYTVRNVVLSVIFIYVLGILVVIPPLAGFGKIRLNEKMGICLFAAYDTLTYWYTQSILHGVVAGPAIAITVYCYVKVILYFQRTQKALKRMQQGRRRDRDPDSDANGDTPGDRGSRSTKSTSLSTPTPARSWDVKCDSEKVPPPGCGDRGYNDPRHSHYHGKNHNRHRAASAAAFSDEIDSSRLEDLDLSSSGNHSGINKDGTSGDQLNGKNGVEDRQLGQHNRNQYKTKAKRARASRRVITNLMTVFIVFLIFWLPIIVIFTVDFGNKAPAWVSHVAITFAISNSSVNVFIYAGMNRIFRRSYYYLLVCQLGKLKAAT